MNIKLHIFINRFFLMLVELMFSLFYGVLLVSLLTSILALLSAQTLFLLFALFGIPIAFVYGLPGVLTFGLVSVFILNIFDIKNKWLWLLTGLIMTLPSTFLLLIIYFEDFDRNDLIGLLVIAVPVGLATASFAHTRLNDPEIDKRIIQEYIIMQKIKEKGSNCE